MKEIKEILSCLSWIDYTEEIQEYINNNYVSKKDAQLLAKYGFTINK